MVTYNVGRNINYTNVCWVQCKFCAFYRSPKADDAYVLPHEDIHAKIQALVDVGGYEILIQGGLNPKLKINYYEGLFGEIRSRFPDVHIHGLSPSEVLYIAKISKLTLEATLTRLRNSGMATIPGAGGEILDDEARDVIAPYKDSTEEWLHVMRVAHGLEMRSTATMMYGHVETIEHRIKHLMRVRELQDETGGFTAFAAWNFQPDGTDLAIEKKASGLEHLKMMALCRLMLDNVDGLQASWVTQGPKIAQASLEFGVNDFGQTMMEENVVSAAGTSHSVNAPEICRLIRNAGYTPRLRNAYYDDMGDPDDLPTPAGVAQPIASGR